MRVSFDGNGDGFAVQVKVTWKVLNAFCKMAVTTVISVAMLWPTLTEHLHNLI